MEVKILDASGRQLTADELKQLSIWNETMSHICASALERLQQEEIAIPVSVAET